MNERFFSRTRPGMNATVTTAGHCFLGKVENLSMNGMFLVTPERLGTGEQVEIKMLLDSGAPEISLCFHATVRRMDDKGLGFAFEKIDADSYIHLKNIISYIHENTSIKSKISGNQHNG